MPGGELVSARAPSRQVPRCSDSGPSVIDSHIVTATSREFGVEETELRRRRHTSAAWRLLSQLVTKPP